MKVSQNNHRLQKTKYLGFSAKGRVELEDRQRVLREFLATSKGETSEFEYGSLERILSRENLLLAMKRVIPNKGSYGVDGMTVAQELNYIYDENFSENSFGFRPRRWAKDAIQKSETYINDGYRWVVDIDLEKFFDKVNYDILMYKLSRYIKDKRALRLIRKYLQFGIMINGIVVTSEEGIPQGAPLSPLLSFIKLKEPPCTRPVCTVVWEDGK